MMTKIKLRSLELHFFKGIRQWRMECNTEGSIRISGANGTGKTTIADAIQWCLFGRNSTGDAQFGIKTLDSEGRVIPNVEHSVTMGLAIESDNGKLIERDFKRVWVEKRIKRRGRETGAVEHVTEFYIDGESYSKVDYDNLISSLLTSKEVFWLVSNPTYFFGLAWKEQRRLLQELVGELDYTKVNEDYVDVIARLKEYEDLEGYKKHLAYNIKLVKEKLATIPARIDEQQQTMPSEEDWDKLESDILQKGNEAKSLSDSISKLKADNSGLHRNNLLRQKIEFQNKRIDNMRVGARNMAELERQKHEDELHKVRTKLAELQQTIRNLEDARHSQEILLERSRLSLQQLKDETQAFREEWKANETRQFAIDEENLVCPTCGRTYDAEKQSEIIAEAKDRFASQKASTKERLLARAEDIKQRKAVIEATIKSYEDMLALPQDSKHQELEALKKAEGDIALKHISTADELLENNPGYIDARKQIDALTQELNTEDVATDNSQAVAELEGQLKEVEKELSAMRSRLAVRDNYVVHKQRIAQLEQESETLNEQLSELMNRDDGVCGYEQAMNELLEGAVNSHFNNVHFRLFETLNDNTKKPWCVATVNGVEFSDVNRAAQLNAGLEICNVFAREKNVIAPIVVDNAECINTLHETLGQQIRFYVSNQNELTIENENE